MTAVEGVAHADPAASWLVLPCHEAQLHLRLGRVVRVAGVRGLEDGAGIATLRHEHLGRVVDFGELDLLAGAFS